MNFICILLLATCGVSLGNITVTYTLTTRDGVSSNFTNANYTNVYFNPNLQYKIICHGWQAVNSWYVNITREYLDKSNMGIIAAYYEQAVADPLYVGAAKNVPKIGQIVGNLTIALHLNQKIPLQNFHCIGHSLGAHVCGNAGQTVNSTLNNRIGRATGLDPAAPGFFVPGLPYPDQNRLNINKAIFVDIIHSSAIYGITKAIGSIDFYPNGGVQQPGCNSTSFNSCNHGMAVVFFIESINNITFVAYQCATYLKFKAHDCDNAETALMGDPVQQNKNGTYYLTTNASIIYDYYSIFQSGPQTIPTNIDFLV